jgi:sulfite reductase (ferredoxin)
MTTEFYKLPADLAQDIDTYGSEVGRFSSGEMPPGVFKAKRVPRGVYEQRQDGAYMVRVRVAGGTLTPEQGETLADIGSAFGSHQLHITTRQDVQIHDVKIEHTPEIMRRLLSVGLTSKGGGGNTVRNVAACPYAGICPAEEFDVTPFAHAVTEFLIPLVGSYNLPRKYKISFSGCGLDCALARVNDLGFIAKAKDGKPGFLVYAGGGLGAHSRPGDLIEEWVPATDVVRIAEAIRRLFDQLGDRKNRQRARLRFVFERMGMPAFRNALHGVIRELETEGIQDCAVSVPDIRSPAGASLIRRETDSASGVRFLEQRQAGHVALPLHLPLGFISAEDFRKISRISREFSQENGFRTTRSQNLIIRFVAKDDLAALASKLKGLKCDVVKPAALESFVACAGAATCRLGLCLARDAARACAEALDRSSITPAVLASLDVNISGCPNACGQHHVASIGLFGAAQRTAGRLVPSYRVLLGARCDTPTARLAELAGSVPARALPQLLLDLAQDFEKDRLAGEWFSSYFERCGMEHFKAIIERHATVPSYEERPAFYRDWGSDDDFSLAGRGGGECGAGVFEVIADDIAGAKRALHSAQSSSESADMFEALLPAARALLITRGVDSQNATDIIQAFEKHFIDTGLVPSEFRGLISRARGYLEGWREALEGQADDIGRLLAEVEALFGTLDANLNFHRAESAASNETSASAPVREKPAAVAELDLRGVTCPMNFVKVKLKLESMETDDLLAVVLDDGEPVQNVPASLRSEGQEVVDTVDLNNGHWRITVRKKK